MMVDDAISTADMDTILDVVGAFWDDQPHYAALMIESMGRPRAMAAALAVIATLVETAAASSEDVTREQALGMLRGWAL